MAALTERSIGGMEATGLEIADTDCTGLKLRLGKTAFTWAWVGRDPNLGKVVRKPLGAWPTVSVKQARLAADSLRTSMATAAAGRKQIGKAVTFDKLVEDYLTAKARNAAASSMRTAKATLARPRRDLGSRLAGSIRRSDIINLLDGLVAEGKNRTANATKFQINAVLEHGVTRELISANPLNGYRDTPGGNPPPRERVLSPDEIETLWKALDAAKMPEVGRTVLRLLIATGQRLGEVSGLTWEELDMDVGLWRLPAGRAKNKRAHRIPLTDLALRLLRELPQADSGPLFRTSTGAPLPPARVSTWVSQQSWPIEHWTAHDLRRSAATGMRANGCAVADIAALLNHTEIGITAKIYARSDRWPEKVRAVDSLDQWLKLCRVA